MKSLLRQTSFRLLCIIALLTLLFSGCARTKPAVNGDQLSVVATTTIVGDVVSRIAGEHIQLTALLPPDADPHAFEPKPAHIAEIAEADLVFANGVGLETFLEPLIQNAGGNAQVVEVSVGIPFLHLDESHESEAGVEVHGDEDPHVWHNPLNILVWVENITQALIQADAQNADDYLANGEVYSQELRDLDRRIQELVDQVPVENRLLVSDHLTFGYFADRYGFKVIQSVIPGYSTLASPSAQDLAALQDQIGQFNIRAIFVGYSVNPAIYEQIANDTGAKLVFVYTGALSQPGKDGESYIQMMEYNARAITSALK